MGKDLKPWRLVSKQLGEAGHFAECWTYLLGQAVVGRQLYSAERIAAMPNLGLSLFSPRTHQGACLLC